MQGNAESELLSRCVNSIAGMGDSPTVVVDADDFSDASIASVATQLEDKGWTVEVLSRDGTDPAQLVISAPPAAQAAAPAQAERPKSNGLREQRQAEALNKWVAFEQAQAASNISSSASTWTAGKTSIVLAIIFVVAFAIVWAVYIGPRRQLDRLAQETCDDLDGSIMLVAISTVNSSVKKAERLGFSGPELGARMREKCPSLMRQLENFANSY